MRNVSGTYLRLALALVILFAIAGFAFFISDVVVPSMARKESQPAAVQQVRVLPPQPTPEPARTPVETPRQPRPEVERHRSAATLPASSGAASASAGPVINTLACGDSYVPLPRAGGNWIVEVPVGGCLTNILTFNGDYLRIALVQFSGDVEVDILYKMSEAPNADHARVRWGPLQGDLRDLFSVLPPGVAPPPTLTGVRFRNPFGQPVRLEVQLFP